MIKKILPILSLLKFKVSLAVTFTAITGFIVFSGTLSLQVLFLALGVFILASGASALNQYQEREYDKRMQRTQSRPLPSGRISPLSALIVSVVCIMVGLLILLYFSAKVTAALGLFNVLWYNGLYTPLKRLSPFAVVPGSLTGAIPVLMGWTAAGGYVFDATIVFIAFFIFIWQIPHFWLLMLKYGTEYEKAGFPTINQSVHPKTLKLIIFSWILATSVFSMMLPIFITHISLVFFIAVLVLNILFISIFTLLSFGKPETFHKKNAFISINVYMFLFMVMLGIYHLLGGV